MAGAERRFPIISRTLRRWRMKSVLVRSVQRDAFNHDPGELLLMTGSTSWGVPPSAPGCPTAWGASPRTCRRSSCSVPAPAPSAGSNNWANGFLPSIFQGTRFRGEGEPILYLSSPSGINREMQRARLDALRVLNERRLKETGDPEIAARIASYELAFRMQIAAPELLDFSKESAAVMEAYGVNREATRHYGCTASLPDESLSAGSASLCSLTAAGTFTTARQAAKEELRRRRPADGGLAQGSQAARAARQHSGCLGW